MALFALGGRRGVTQRAVPASTTPASRRAPFSEFCLHSPLWPGWEQKPFPKPPYSGSRISTWIWLLEQTWGRSQAMFLEQRHKHITTMWWQGSLQAPSSSNPKQEFRLIQHSWGQTTESMEKKGYYPCSCTERMLNSQQRLLFQSNSQVCVTKVEKGSVPGALSKLDPQLFGPPLPYPCFVHFPGSPMQKD